MDREAEFELIGGVFCYRKPFWTDRCFHQTQSYLASFESFYRSAEGCRIEEKIDLYIFDQNDNIGSSFCMRFGEEDSQYYSGWVSHLFRYAEHEPYHSALEVILSLGRIVWECKKQKEGDCE